MLESSEQTHIKKYRDLDGHGKKIVDIVTDEEHTRITAIRQKETPALLPFIVDEEEPKKGNEGVFRERCCRNGQLLNE